MASGVLVRLSVSLEVTVILKDRGIPGPAACSMIHVCGSPTLVAKPQMRQELCTTRIDIRSELRDSRVSLGNQANLSLGLSGLIPLALCVCYVS